MPHLSAHKQHEVTAELKLILFMTSIIFNFEFIHRVKLIISLTTTVVARACLTRSLHPPQIYTKFFNINFFCRTDS
jgi:H+/Cl- antiporter ClcA